MTVVAILQARTNSSRLPAKVLLPIATYPMVVLAAKRAANTGCDVIVTTSIESSDDVLYDTVTSYGLTCFRGSLDNTLNRVNSALKSYDDETIVIRLTADNVFPDGTMLKELEEFFINEKLDYLCCNGVVSGLPYGVSAEITRLKYLREAENLTQDKYDLEHVTPYIRKKYGETYFKKYNELNMGNYRCTVDCLDDYLSISRVFKDVDDPINESFISLCYKLKQTGLFQPIISKLPKKMVLGTAQLGMDYGISNNTGMPSKKVAEDIIKTAISNGVEYLDTAFAYGESEKVLGDILSAGWQDRVSVITKLSPNYELSESFNKREISALVENNIFQSLIKLKSKKIDVLMLHRAIQLFDYKGFIWDKLIELKNAGLIGGLGVSVQTVEELEAVLDIEMVEFIQMPYNILDNRWEKCVAKIIDTKSKRNLKIHVRSTLLQGLLTCRNVLLWKKAHVNSPHLIWDWLSSFKTEVIHSDLELCLTFVNSLNWVDGIVVGIESLEQLQENIGILSKEQLPSTVVQQILNSRPNLTEKTLNPALWSRDE